jgi:hypothetical protein
MHSDFFDLGMIECISKLACMLSLERSLALKKGSPHARLMRWTCLLLGFLILTILPGRAGHSAPKIFLRVHVQTAGEGQSPMEATTVKLPPNGEEIQVHTLPDLTEDELIDAQQDASGVLRLRFNHQGQVALSVLTAENQNRIMIVMINGFVIYAPVIDEQITTGELDIPHPVNAQALQLLQDRAKENNRKALKT